MEKKFFLLGVAVLLSASLFFLGCPTDDSTDDPVKSDNAAVTGSVTVKGQTVTLGTEAGTFADPIKGAVTLDVDGAAAFVYTKPEGATAKAVLSTTELDDEAAFNDEDAFDNGAISGGTSYLYLKVTAEDGETVKWYKITVTVTNVDITASNTRYSLVESEDEPEEDAPYGVDIASVWKDAADETKVTIKLTGTFKADYLHFAKADKADSVTGANWNTDNWTVAEATPAVGTYGEVTLKGLFPTIPTETIAIKNTNPAFNVFKGVNGLATNLNAPGVRGGDWKTLISLPENEVPFRWALYKTDDVLKITADAFSVLLLDGAATESLTLLIQEYDDEESSVGNTILTVTIDYSGVTFENEAELTPTP